MFEFLNGKCKSANSRTHTQTTHTQHTYTHTHNTAHQISSGDTGFSAAARAHACAEQSLGLRGLQWSRYVVYGPWATSVWACMQFCFRTPHLGSIPFRSNEKSVCLHVRVSSHLRFHTCSKHTATWMYVLLYAFAIYVFTPCAILNTCSKTNTTKSV
jgi:hypothetical protein